MPSKPRRPDDIVVARRSRRQWADRQGTAKGGTRRPPAIAATGETGATRDRRTGPAPGGLVSLQPYSDVGGFILRFVLLTCFVRYFIYLTIYGFQAMSRSYHDRQFPRGVSDTVLLY